MLMIFNGHDITYFTIYMILYLYNQLDIDGIN